MLVKTYLLTSIKSCAILLLDMSLTAKRKVLVQKDKEGRIKSKALSIPVEMVTGDEHTMAANALILSDPAGILTKEALDELLQSIEPTYWKKRSEIGPAP